MANPLLLPLLLALLVAAAAPAARAAEAGSSTLPPLALGGDRLVFAGRKASAVYRAAMQGSVADGPFPESSGNSSSLALRFGRLAELNATTDEIVRRVPSLARVTPSQITTGTKTATNGTLEFVLLAYDGAALALAPCPTAPAADNTTAAVEAAEALAAAAEAAALAATVEIEVLLTSPEGGAVALPYANETVVVPAGGFKWSVDVQRWPYCSAGNTLALDVVFAGEGTYDAAPRVYGGGPGNASHGSPEASFGDGLYVPGGLGGGVLGGAGDGDNDDADEAAEREGAGQGVGSGGGGRGDACEAALRALGNATDGSIGEERAIAPAWFMPNVLTNYTAAVVPAEGSVEGSVEGSAGSASSSSPASVPAPARRSLLAAAAAADEVEGGKKEDDDDKPKPRRFNCSERADKQRKRNAEAAVERLAAIEAEAAAIVAAVSAGGSSSIATTTTTTSASAEAATPSSSSRKLLRELKKEDDDDNKNKAARASVSSSSSSSSSSGRRGRTRVSAAAAAAAAAAAQRAREEGVAAAASRHNANVSASAAAAAAKDACASPSALLAASRALGLPRIRARPRQGTPLGDAFVMANAAATAAAAASGAAVASSADVVGDVLCPASAAALSAKVVNASALGGGNGRVRARAPDRGRLATLLLSPGVAAKLELPAFAVDGDPLDPAAPQIPVDVLVLPDAEDASSAVTRYLFQQPASASARLHYDPTTSAAPAEDAYSLEEIQDAASAPVPTFDGAFMMEEAVAATGDAAGEAPPKAKSAAGSASASATGAAAAAGAGLLLLLLL